MIIVTDDTGTDGGRITQQNIVGKIRFDLEAGGRAVGSINVVRIHQDLADPLLSLVVAAAMSVDTALKQDSR